MAGEHACVSGKQTRDMGFPGTGFRTARPADAVHASRAKQWDVDVRTRLSSLGPPAPRQRCRGLPCMPRSCKSVRAVSDWSGPGVGRDLRPSQMFAHCAVAVGTSLALLRVASCMLVGGHRLPGSVQPGQTRFPESPRNMRSRRPRLGIEAGEARRCSPSGCADSGDGAPFGEEEGSFSRGRILRGHAGGLRGLPRTPCRHVACDCGELGVGPDARPAGQEWNS